MTYPKPLTLSLDSNMFAAMALYDRRLHSFNYFTNGQPPRMVSTESVQAALDNNWCPSCGKKAKLIQSPGAKNYNCCGLKVRELHSSVVMAPRSYSFEPRPIVNTGVYRHRVAIRPGLQLDNHRPSIPNSLVHNLYAHGIRYVMGANQDWDFSHFFTLRTRDEEQIFLHLCDVLGYRHIEM